MSCPCAPDPGALAVLVSSHLLSETQLLADHVVVIGRGRLLADEPMDRFARRGAHRHVRVRSPDAARLAELVATVGGTPVELAGEAVTVSGTSPQAIGDLAWEHRLRLHELAASPASLEAAFLDLTGPAAEHAPEPLTPPSRLP